MTVSTPLFAITVDAHDPKTVKAEKIEYDVLGSTNGSIFNLEIPRYKWHSGCLQRETLKAILSYLHKNAKDKFIEFCKFITAEELFTSADISNVSTVCVGESISRRKLWGLMKPESVGFAV